MATPDLTTFKALSFDCYGTLVDWESGLLAGLQPILADVPASSPEARDPKLLARHFHTISTRLEQSDPGMRYDRNLARSFGTLARGTGAVVSDEEAETFAKLPGTWAPFEDTRAGLEVLRRHYKLIILSNIDRANMEGTLAQFAGVFDGVYVAEDIGRYKPSHRNFAYLFSRAKEDLGVDADKGELLHVARSLTADHVPAKQLGLRSVWISRGGEVRGDHGVGGDYAELKDDVAFEWRFDTIGAFAEEVERQFRLKRSS
ncbi:hypothetical protein C8034_v009728 [Colletotrichum sidae]|uniref:Haloacid dehalogenase n=1 Tax=Colletotrichum sidae TaxID=1347389 RepID=A0A4R8PXT4_9PEZI|nr:hypothetical protein C8034_v009728 [Colletotrichum sidae]